MTFWLPLASSRRWAPPRRSTWWYSEWRRFRWNLETNNLDRILQWLNIDRRWDLPARWAQSWMIVERRVTFAEVVNALWPWRYLFWTLLRRWQFRPTRDHHHIASGSELSVCPRRIQCTDRNPWGIRFLGQSSISAFQKLNEMAEVFDNLAMMQQRIWDDKWIHSLQCEIEAISRSEWVQKWKIW